MSMRQEPPRVAPPQCRGGVFLPFTNLWETKMFLIQVILTITAAARGWKWWALAPLAIGFATAFQAGAIFGEPALKFICIMDVSVAIALIAMCFLPPAKG